MCIVWVDGQGGEWQPCFTRVICVPEDARRRTSHKSEIIRGSSPPRGSKRATIYAASAHGNQAQDSGRGFRARRCKGGCNTFFPKKRGGNCCARRGLCLHGHGVKSRAPVSAPRRPSRCLSWRRDVVRAGFDDRAENRARTSCIAAVEKRGALCMRGAGHVAPAVRGRGAPAPRVYAAGEQCAMREGERGCGRAKIIEDDGRGGDERGACDGEGLPPVPGMLVVRRRGEEECPPEALGTAAGVRVVMCVVRGGGGRDGRWRKEDICGGVSYWDTSAVVKVVLANRNKGYPSDEGRLPRALRMWLVWTWVMGTASSGDTWRRAEERRKMGAAAVCVAGGRLHWTMPS
ncbi:hypothetical protein C8J57DRAFT_1255868 [Mycena rebaudengoi]|nr:hypothetical protein C8J57DRAFT_1255868 [Mycena rebaudengoi]